jgi:hypothetical protein
MKVQIDTFDRSVHISANDSTKDLETMDKWIKAIKVAREWLRKEREVKS